MKKTIFTSVVFAAAIVVAQTGTQVSQTKTTSTTTGATTNPAGGTTATTDSTGAAAIGAPMLATDGEIAKVLLTVDEGEIEASEVAVKKAKTKEVIEFAKMMVKHHRANKKVTRDLIKFTDRDASDLSKSAKEDAKTAKKQLKQENRDTFDRAYVQQQIDRHQKALNLLDASLMPSAKTDSMRTHLQKTRETVSIHLTEAQSLKIKFQ